MPEERNTNSRRRLSKADLLIKPSLHWRCLAQLHPQYRTEYIYIGLQFAQDAQGKYNSGYQVSLSLVLSP